MKDAESNADQKLMAMGTALLVFAFACGETRDFIPSLATKSVTVTAEVATMSERDDARVFRAFASAREGPRTESGLEPLPKEYRDIRKTQLWVRAPTGDAARNERDRIIEGMRKAFTSEGKGEIQFNPRNKAVPVPNETSILLGQLMRWITALSALGGLAALGMGGRRIYLKEAPKHPPLPPVAKAAVIYVPVLIILALMPHGTTLPLFPSPMNEVSSWALLMLVMAIPFFITFVMIYKMREVKKASHWSAGRARITKSKVKTERHRHAGDVTKVTNLAEVAYEFPVGSRTYQGERISIGETMGTEVEAALKRYPVGASVPVYYDPDDPKNCVLEREPPANPGCLFAIALFLWAGGFVVAAVFLSPDGFSSLLEPWFPKNAHPVFAIFFTVAGLMTLMIMWGNRRMAAQAASWPQVQGRVVRSETESYVSHSGAGHGTASRLYEPVIEYAYKVGDREYHSTQLSFGAKVARGSSGAADETVARYPIGSAVQVHYDPDNPSQSVIDLKVAMVLPALILAVVFLLLAAYFGGAFGSR